MIEPLAFPAVARKARSQPRIGFLGAGWIARLRLEAILRARNCEVVAVVDPSRESRHEALTLCNTIIAPDSMEDLWDLDLDGIVISTPSALHAEQTTACLERGLAVFCQKPLGRNSLEVSKILKTAQQQDRLLGVDLCYRHLTGLRKARELVASGSLGSIFAADLIFHNAYGPNKEWFYDPALSGGGCVIDLGIHLVDTLFWTLNASPFSVSSNIFHKGKRWNDESIAEDFASIHLETEQGTTAHLACSWHLHAGRDAQIEFHFHGTDGGLSVRNVDGSFYDFATEFHRGTKSEIIAHPADNWGEGAILEWIEHLGLSPKFDPRLEEQLVVARVLDAIYGRLPRGEL